MGYDPSIVDHYVDDYKSFFNSSDPSILSHDYNNRRTQIELSSWAKSTTQWCPSEDLITVYRQLYRTGEIRIRKSDEF